jgi:hypothetical protein
VNGRHMWPGVVATGGSGGMQWWHAMVGLQWWACRDGMQWGAEGVATLADGESCRA